MVTESNIRFLAYLISVGEYNNLVRYAKNGASKNIFVTRKNYWR